MGEAGNRLIALAWNPSAGAAGYQLSRATNPSGPFTLLASNMTAASYQDLSAINGRTNYYEIAAWNGCLLSGSSPAIGVFLPRPALTMTNVTGESLTIAWPAWASDWTLKYTTNLMPPVLFYARDQCRAIQR